MYICVNINTIYMDSEKCINAFNSQNNFFFQKFQYDSKARVYYLFYNVDFMTITNSENANIAKILSHFANFKFM